MNALTRGVVHTRILPDFLFRETMKIYAAHPPVFCPGRRRVGSASNVPVGRKTLSASGRGWGQGEVGMFIAAGVIHTCGSTADAGA